MGHLLSVIAEGFLNIWSCLHKQRDLDESSVVGQSEFEKEGRAWMWVAIIGGALLLMIVCLMVFR